MNRKDPIFWAAASLFVLALALFGLTQNQLWLALMVGSYLLRPTLASLGIAKRLVDERQMSIQYRSGNIAFAVMIITCIILAVIQNTKGDPSWELFNIIIVLGLGAKALANVMLVGNYRESAVKIIMVVGLLMALFASFELGKGFSVRVLLEMAPGVGIIGIGWLARKFPRSIGGVLIVATIALVSFVLSKGITIGQISTALLIFVPLVTACVCLIVGNRGDTETDSGMGRLHAN